MKAAVVHEIKYSILMVYLIKRPPQRRTQAVSILGIIGSDLCWISGRLRRYFPIRMRSNKHWIIGQNGSDVKLYLIFGRDGKFPGHSGHSGQDVSIDGWWMDRWMDKWIGWWGRDALSLGHSAGQTSVIGHSYQLSRSKLGPFVLVRLIECPGTFLSDLSNIGIDDVIFRISDQIMGDDVQNRRWCKRWCRCIWYMDDI